MYVQEYLNIVEEWKSRQKILFFQELVREQFLNWRCDSV